MTDIDTSEEAFASRLVDSIDLGMGGGERWVDGRSTVVTKAELRALLAEREALREEVTDWKGIATEANSILAAENARLTEREAMWREAVDILSLAADDYWETGDDPNNMAEVARVAGLRDALGIDDD